MNLILLLVCMFVGAQAASAAGRGDDYVAGGLAVLTAWCFRWACDR